MLRRLRCQEDLRFKTFRAPFGGDHRGTEGGGGVRPNPAPPSPLQTPSPPPSLPVSVFPVASQFFGSMDLSGEVTPSLGRSGEASPESPDTPSTPGRRSGGALQLDIPTVEGQWAPPEDSPPGRTGVFTGAARVRPLSPGAELVSPPARASGGASPAALPGTADAAILTPTVHSPSHRKELRGRGGSTGGGSFRRPSDTSTSPSPGGGSFRRPSDTSTSPPPEGRSTSLSLTPSVSPNRQVWRARPSAQAAVALSVGMGKAFLICSCVCCCTGIISLGKNPGGRNFAALGNPCTTLPTPLTFARGKFRHRPQIPKFHTKLSSSFTQREGDKDFTAAAGRLPPKRSWYTADPATFQLRFTAATAEPWILRRGLGGDV